jgi:SAM-dependent methyltransferase
MTDMTMMETAAVTTSRSPCSHDDGDDDDDDDDDHGMISNSNDDNSNDKYIKLPPSGSPAARAFFAALDGQPKTLRGGGAGADDSCGPTRKKKQSDFVSKRIQTLGWRNRYSQQEQYPVSISIIERRSDGGDDDDDDDKHHGDGDDGQQSAAADSSSIVKRNFTFSVRQVQRGELEGTYGTGATVWPASLVLVKYLERHAKTLLKNKIVVDLGAGTGITSIAAAWLGAKRVICTDGEAPVVQLARDNIAQVVLDAAPKVAAVTTTTTSSDDTEQSVGEDARTKAAGTTSHNSFVLNGCPIETQEYWWGTGTINGMNEDKDKDDLVVLVSDCVLPKLYPIAPLVEALDALLPSSSSSSSNSSNNNNNNNNSGLAILSYEHRHYADYDPRDKFRELAAAKNLHMAVVDMEQQDPVYSVDDIEIWHVTRV